MAGTEQLRFTCDPCFTHGTPLREDRAFLHKLLAFFHSSGRDCAGTGHCIKAHVVVVDDADVDGDEDLLHTLATDLWDLAPDEARTRFRELCGAPLPGALLPTVLSEARALLGATASALVPAGEPRPAAPPPPPPAAPPRATVRYAKPGCDIVRERSGPLARHRPPLPAAPRRPVPLPQARAAAVLRCSAGRRADGRPTRGRARRRQIQPAAARQVAPGAAAGAPAPGAGPYPARFLLQGEARLSR